MGESEVQPEARRDQGKDKTKEGRRARKKKLQRLQYQRRRERWTRRYGSLRALQATFGRGPPGGDLSPQQTRALYHALLPRAVLSLNEMGLMRPEDLAPLAYEARIAAKEYARSRCVWTGRVATSLFDQYRSLRDRGQFLGPGSSASASWEELWDKYEERIVAEEHERKLDVQGKKDVREREKNSVVDRDLANRIYMRILERSCATNQAFDSLFLVDDGAEDGNELAAIARQLDSDVRAILLPPKEGAKEIKKMEKRKQKQREANSKAKKKLEKTMTKQSPPKEDKR